MSRGTWFDALIRVLEHAESHGEVYHGATDDHKAIRAQLGALDPKASSGTPTSSDTPGA
jgi:hypothetical protein